MIFDLMSQESELAVAKRAAGLSGEERAGQALRRVLWRYALVLWCGVALALGSKSVVVGGLLVWYLFPVWVGMRLSTLEHKGRVVQDGGQHSWLVTLGGATAREKIVTLKNAFFHSAEDMKRVLLGFSLVRCVLYVLAVLLAVYDMYAAATGAATELGSIPGMPAWPLISVSLVHLLFYARRGRAYYRLFRLGWRGDWEVGTFSTGEHTLFAAYKPFRDGSDTFHVPYLLAVTTPQLA